MLDPWVFRFNSNIFFYQKWLIHLILDDKNIFLEKIFLYGSACRLNWLKMIKNDPRWSKRPKYIYKNLLGKLTFRKKWNQKVLVIQCVTVYTNFVSRNILRKTVNSDASEIKSTFGWFLIIERALETSNCLKVANLSKPRQMISRKSSLRIRFRLLFKFFEE